MTLTVRVTVNLQIHACVVKLKAFGGDREMSINGFNIFLYLSLVKRKSLKAKDSCQNSLGILQFALK